MDSLVTLDETTIDELCLTDRILRKMVGSHVLIGASAILLHGINLLRTTRDLDFVILVKDVFANTAKSLTNLGFKQSFVANKFYTPRGTEIDLLPLKRGTTVIELPNGGNIVSPGFKEALKYAEEIDIGRCSVFVAPISILVALKILAATKRHKSDLQDALTCMEEYEKKGTCRFEEIDWSRSPDLTFETAGAYLLGRELAKLADHATLNVVYKIIQQFMKEESPQETKQSGKERGPLLRAFALGLTEEESTPI